MTHREIAAGGSPNATASRHEIHFAPGPGSRGPVQRSFTCATRSLGITCVSQLGQVTDVSLALDSASACFS